MACRNSPSTQRYSLKTAKYSVQRSISHALQRALQDGVVKITVMRPQGTWN